MTLTAGSCELKPAARRPIRLSDYPHDFGHSGERGSDGTAIGGVPKKTARTAPPIVRRVADAKPSTLWCGCDISAWLAVSVPQTGRQPFGLRGASSGALHRGGYVLADTTLTALLEPPVASVSRLALASNRRLHERKKKPPINPTPPPPTEDEIKFGDELPVLPIRNAVLFPGAVAPFDVGREKIGRAGGGRAQPAEPGDRDLRAARSVDGRSERGRSVPGRLRRARPQGAQALERQLLADPAGPDPHSARHASRRHRPTSGREITRLDDAEHGGRRGRSAGA